MDYSSYINDSQSSAMFDISKQSRYFYSYHNPALYIDKLQLHFLHIN